MATADGGGHHWRTFRLLSYNVNGLRSGTERVAEVVGACAADVVCVQESPRLLRWRSKCAELARRSGMEMLAGGYPAGLLVLGRRSRVRVVRTEARWLSFVPRYLQRGLTLAVLDVDGARVTVANMHLDLGLAGRRRHLGEILARLDRMQRDYGGAPALLVGDVNEQPTGPVWRILAGRLQDTYAVAPSGAGETFPAADPRRRIDGIFADPAFGVRGCGVPDDVPGIAEASDHRPVLAELALPGDGHDKERSG